MIKMCESVVKKMFYRKMYGINTGGTERSLVASVFD